MPPAFGTMSLPLPFGVKSISGIRCNAYLSARHNSIYQKLWPSTAGTRLASIRSLSIILIFSTLAKKSTSSFPF